MELNLVQAIQERHENSLLKTEIDKLRDENKQMRETINKSCCPNCGTATTTRDTLLSSEEQHLRIENAKLKAEVGLHSTYLGVCILQKPCVLVHSNSIGPIYERI